MFENSECEGNNADTRTRERNAVRRGAWAAGSLRGCGSLSTTPAVSEEQSAGQVSGARGESRRAKTESRSAQATVLREVLSGRGAPSSTPCSFQSYLWGHSPTQLPLGAA